MIRTAGLTLVAALGLIVSATRADAQVFVRVPFVQVETGNGVYVRAPFVRVWVPPAYVVPPPATIQVVPPQPPTVFVPNPPTVIVPQPPAPVPPPPAAPEVNNVSPAPPQPLQVKYPTLNEFARSFQARAGQ